VPIDGIYVVCAPTTSSTSTTDHLIVQSTSVAPIASVRDLGVHLDSDMSMHTHITQLTCSCYEVLRQLRSIRRSLPRSALTTLVTSFIMSKVDYCNVALAGSPQYELDRVQSVINAAARHTADSRRYNHVTQLLVDLVTLSSGSITYPVQAVCAGVRLPERNSTGILVGPDSVCRQYCTSSATLSVDL